MDFYEIRERAVKNGVIEIYPEFLIAPSNDLMVQAKSFVGVWDEQKKLWSTTEYDVARIVDSSLDEYYRKNIDRYSDNKVKIKRMSEYSSTAWTNYRSWISKLPDNVHALDQTLIFADTKVRREDYASKKLSYSLSNEFPEAWNTLIGRLYAPDERAKIEWAIGSVVSGDSKKIQKFLVLYGDTGTGKSTILQIIMWLFEGYYSVFEAQSLGQASNQFATEAFKNLPLVAIQHDGDLSRIEDNTRLNSITAHEEMIINEKNKPLYNAAINAFLFMGTNKPVKITDSKSGIIRRLIDAKPTGKRFSPDEYDDLMGQIRNSLGAIANHCLEVYRSMGKDYYKNYIPITMMQKTDVFYNFVDYNSLDLMVNDPISLNRAWDLYIQYVETTKLEYKMPQYKFREALKDYYEEFLDREIIDGKRVRSVYKGFKEDKLNQGKLSVKPTVEYKVTLDQSKSLLDDILADCKAQYSTSDGTPRYKWDNVKTTLSDLDTSKEHYVLFENENHIVIDFDLTDENGNKSREKNLEAASEFPPTYSEYSKSGNGVHLHYIYDGDATKLSSVYAPGIEVKVYSGKSSLRRKLTYCNSQPISHISRGLPIKDTKMINTKYATDEKNIRNMIERNLRKEYHGATKPSVDFIKKILDDAYSSGVDYDVSDMKPAIMSFAAQSTNQANAALKAFSEMKFCSKAVEEDAFDNYGTDKVDIFDYKDEDLVFFDVEVYPNVFILVWKRYGEETTNKIVDPSPEYIENFVDMPIVGFNNRRYDNHILYARYMGASNQELYNISMRIVNGDRDAMFSNAYNISYTDIYDFSTKKQGLKKWEIELGINHVEVEFPWDEPLAEDDLPEAIRYCENDVIATEKVFKHLKQDWNARKILAKISGLTPNHTTNNITQKIVFGEDRTPPFIHTDLSKDFPGYIYKNGKSHYRDEIIGEGGYVYSEPGIYHNVALLDIASMHPHSMIAMNVFGDIYTKKFKELVEARIAVKHHDKETAKKLLNGSLAPYLGSDEEMDILSHSLKLPINSVYGLTAANFPNRFNGNNPRNNRDNIVAKRGSLFMVDLKHYIQEQGYKVIHIKTDSVKIDNADQNIIDKVTEYGAKYGYFFEHEATYEKICLVNDAVYIAKQGDKWYATGAQFQHPIVYKTLFSKEPIDISDYYETKSVTTALYLDWPSANGEEKEFVGKIGQFLPVLKDGAVLLREKDGKYNAASGTKGYIWNLADRVSSIDQIDMKYYNTLIDKARDAISEYGDLEAFLA